MNKGSRVTFIGKAAGLPAAMGVKSVATVVDAGMDPDNAERILVKLSDGRDVFMKHDAIAEVQPEIAICQVIADLMNGPRLIKGSEALNWQGLEGTGYIAENDKDETIVIDVSEDGISIQLFDPQGELIYNADFTREQTS
jgi:hypothetical protein